MIPSFEILQTIADAYGISVEDIKRRSRHKNIAQARHLVAYLLREINDLSYPAIGDIIGRDHTTAIHSREKIRDQIEIKPNFKEFIEKVLSTLKGRKKIGVVDQNSMTRDEMEYFQVTLSENNTRKKAPYHSLTSEDVLNSMPNIKITEREDGILSKYRAGMTLEEISSTVNVTRERVRQIVMKTIMKELGQKAKDGFKIDVKVYVDPQKDLHKKSRYLSEDQRKEIANKIESGTKIAQVLTLYGLSKEKFLEFFPQRALEASGKRDEKKLLRHSGLNA